MVTPLSGPLQRFGSAAAAGLQVWAEHAADLPAPWRRVRLDLRDAHPDVAFAMREGLKARPHLVFGPYGSGPMLRALAATQRLIWNHGGASARIRWPAFPRAVNVLASAPTYFQGTLEAIRNHDAEARRVTIFHSGTGFGRDIARGAIAAAEELGFDPRAKEFKRGHARQAASSLPEADVLLVAGSFDDELESASAAFVERVDEASSDDAQIVQYVRALEEQYQEGDTPAIPPDSDLSADDILRDVEDLLRGDGP